MCIVCGSGGTRLTRSIARRYAPSQARFVAEEIKPSITPPLDPRDLEELEGPADVIFLGGPILTLRSHDHVAQTLAIRGGRIQAVGGEEAVLARRGRLTRMVDLDGRALVPGFVIADWHPPLSLLCDWLEAANTPAEGIAAAIAETSGEWMILMTDESSEDWIKAANWTTASRPVVMVDRAGAILASNRAAQALAPGIDASRVDPASPQARPHVSMLLPTLLERLAGSHDRLRARLRALMQEAARHGVTTLRFCGLGVLAGPEDPTLVRSAAGDAPPLRLRGAIDNGLALSSGSEGLCPGFGDDMFRIDTAAHWIDETSASLRELAEMVVALRERGWRVTLHAESSAATELALGAFSAAAAFGASLDIPDGLERRDVGVMGTWERAHRLGLSAGIILKSSSMFEDDAPRLGDKRAVPLSLTCDRIAGAPSPLAILSAAAETLGREGARVVDWLPSVTVDASARCGTGPVLGSFEVGKYADFAFLDRDPRRVDLRDATQIACTGTWIAGREIHA